MDWASATVNSTLCRNSLRISPSSIYWEKGSQPICRVSDSLGRALDWLYEHDLTTLFAGLALQARQRFDIEVKQLHVDTTSFSVNGEYLPQKKTGSKGGEASNTGDGSREGEEIPPEPAEERQ